MSSSSVPNPCLSLSIDASSPSLLRMENLSKDHWIVYKFRTSPRYIGQFKVSPLNPGTIGPEERRMVEVNRAKDEEGKRVAKLALVSGMFSFPVQDPRSVSSFSFNNRIFCQAEDDIVSLSLPHSRGRSLLPPPPSFLSSSTPNRSSSFRHPNPVNHADLFSSSSLHNSSMDSMASTMALDQSMAVEKGKEEEDLLDDLDVGIEDETKEEEEKKRSSCCGILTYGLFSLTTVLVHLAFFALYAGPNGWKELPKELGASLFWLLSVSSEDPNLPAAETELMPDLRFWINTSSHLLWIVATAVLFAALIWGKKKLLYPWMAMMVFSQLTASTMLFEMWGIHRTLQDSSPLFNPLVTCVWTIAFGILAILLVWCEIKSW